MRISPRHPLPGVGGLAVTWPRAEFLMMSTEMEPQPVGTEKCSAHHPASVNSRGNGTQASRMFRTHELGHDERQQVCRRTVSEGLADRAGRSGLAGLEAADVPHLLLDVGLAVVISRAEVCVAGRPPVPAVLQPEPVVLEEQICTQPITITIPSN